MSEHMPLGQLGSFSRGRGGTKADEVSIGVPCIRYGELYTRHDCVVREFVSFIHNKATLKYTALRKGDVVFAASGETHEEIGKAAVFIGDESAYAGGDTLIFRPNEGVDPLFLGYAVNSASAARFKAKYGQGSSVIHIAGSHLEHLPLFVPALAEQRRIAEILDTLDEAIRTTEALIAKLEQVKKGLLHDLLTRGVDDNGELRNPERHPEQFKDSPLGRIPREWDVASIGQRMAVRGGKRLPAGHSYAEASTRLKYLRVTDFFQRNYSFRELIDLRPQTFNALRRYEICDGELYLSIAGSLGYAGVYRSDGLHRTILTENAARLVPATVLEPPFVAYQLNSSPVQRQIEMQKGTGGGVPKLALFRIEQLQLTWPSVEEQRAIVDRCQEVDTRIGIELETSKKLCRLRVGLMDDLLSGRVRVSADSQEVSA